MSVLSVMLVPAGILIGADRNVTIRRQFDGGRGVTVEQVGQAQYPKVFEWPNGRAIIGYFGLAEIGETPIHRWLYRFVGRHLSPASLGDVAQALAGELNTELPTEMKSSEALIIHIAGFDEIHGEQAPVVWFIHNTNGLTDDGTYLVYGSFGASEELRTPPPEQRFSGMKAAEIRERLDQLASEWNPFWFKQGSDLGAFNALDAGIRNSMESIVLAHPRKLHPVPRSLGEWSQHLRLAILTYGAYFQAFYPAYEQLVGGGADIVTIPWPDRPSIP